MRSSLYFFPGHCCKGKRNTVFYHWLVLFKIKQIILFSVQTQCAWQYGLEENHSSLALLAKRIFFITPLHLRDEVWEVKLHILNIRNLLLNCFVSKLKVVYTLSFNKSLKCKKKKKESYSKSNQLKKVIILRIIHFLLQNLNNQFFQGKVH